MRATRVAVIYLALLVTFAVSAAAAAETRNAWRAMAKRE